ncbi:hypothetical protein Bca52824_074995 [Brassica carinata]|uniref:Uncharacterized protein n=1 Tax=Brassica carinata TaxID=52824 RepID=A0A8X7PPI7_BRACI|nr:hypothetical protein Bca52824_074995 [Brassica carinata]
MIAPSSTLLLRFRGHHCVRIFSGTVPSSDFFYQEGSKALRFAATRSCFGCGHGSDQSDDQNPGRLQQLCRSRSSKGKDVDLGYIEFSMDDSMLPGWDPNLAYAHGSGSREVPISISMISLLICHRFRLLLL